MISRPSALTSLWYSCFHIVASPGSARSLESVNQRPTGLPSPRSTDATGASRSDDHHLAVTPVKSDAEARADKARDRPHAAQVVPTPEVGQQAVCRRIEGVVLPDAVLLVEGQLVGHLRRSARRGKDLEGHRDRDVSLFPLQVRRALPFWPAKDDQHVGGDADVRLPLDRIPDHVARDKDIRNVAD